MRAIDRWPSEDTHREKRSTSMFRVGNIYVDAVTSLHKETMRRDRMACRRDEARRGREARLDLPCERLFLDLVQFLEGLFREKPLQPLGRGSEMPWDAGSLEQAVRRHGRYPVDGTSTEPNAKGARIIPNFSVARSYDEASRPPK